MFLQFDVHGNAFGLLAAHPTSPFISMHHLDEVDPLFPKLDALNSLRHLANAMHTEPSSFLQQCICYDRVQKLSISISLGYVVQVFPYVVLPRELERPEITFKAWNSKQSRGEFDLDTRRSLRPICRRPFVFYLEDIFVDTNEAVVSTYKRDTVVDERKRHSFCFSKVFPPEQVEKVRVVSRRMSDHWFLVRFSTCVHLWFCLLHRIKKNKNKNSAILMSMLPSLSSCSQISHMLSYIYTHTLIHVYRTIHISSVIFLKMV